MRYLEASIIYNAYYSNGNLRFADRVASLYSKCLTPDNLGDSLKLTMEFCSNHFSYNTATGCRETLSQRRRSIIDLWRHMRTYIPGLELSATMKAMYSINMYLFTSVCRTIERRVFLLQRYGGYFLHLGGYKDEFGLSFDSWQFVTESYILRLVTNALKEGVTD